MGLFDKVFGTYSEREVKRIEPLADKVEALDAEFQKLTDEELKAKTEEFKVRLEKGEALDDLLPEAFATVREASARVLNMKHFRVQIIGGIILHQGRIAEMKTGEGKTLVATLPSYLNALTGNGVHVVTVNDYLASRDRDWMGQIYEFLGLTCGVIVHGLTNEQRKEAYQADITYGTNNEFGFDYLRDNMVVYAERRVQRELNFAIVDEVDSILIDEARTPLIISGQGDKSTEFYKVADFFVKQLKKDVHYTMDEKAKSVVLTEEGVAEAERTFHLENYAEPKNMELQHHVTQALKANYLFRVDKDYMVKDDEVVIVDEFTGRLMEGRRYSDGLHQAIEAKEGVKVERESKTLATITYQNYFRMYKKLSGMTGTALTEEAEFRHTYGLDVIVIPTNKPIRRLDQPDLIYRNAPAKYKAVVAEIKEAYAKKQPVLVGTTSIEKSEYLSTLLKKNGVPHEVLNAKYHEKEAEIVSRAGEPGSITIATNMAGRGTDIKLGDHVIDVGGLKIIGTERHESRRIDNQLRGRSGRQGDPGESRFYLSLEDDLMRIFGSEKLFGMIDNMGLGDDAIESKMVTKSIENAQKKVEGNNFDTRKTLLGYDDVMNMQREVIYGQRQMVLEGKDLKENIRAMLHNVVSTAVNIHLSNGSEREEGIEKLITYMEDIFVPHDTLEADKLMKMTNQDIEEMLYDIGVSIHEEKEQEIGEQIREIERVILLKVVDTKWMEHINNMDHLKRGIGLRAYKQQDPVQAYQFEGSEMFDEMINSINNDTIKYILHIAVRKEEKIEREQVAKETSTNQDTTLKRKPVVKNTRVGRNDPCPCGSGKKYKNCHGAAK
ncbi:preprotein translocase subunit SecA [Proteiniclasticum sp. SCR006]|uniref:Protein translocase subunit SecA n=1 Tax=Proteiniclasticum aestuarii TaxID=2817862 RepID=A0A939HDU2_9CLOT|nr:preprotein translocase subunit SecA [Proteiniclasticum aestuarii]MBO1265730.1 preprotein translocase subunit SecA [Proteiniclasticum aestuarii]